MVIRSLMQKPLDLKLTLTCSLSPVNPSAQEIWTMRHHVLHNHPAVVTGGTSGLGRPLVGELLARGADVAFVARHRADVEQAAFVYRGAHGITGDVSRKE